MPAGSMAIYRETTGGESVDSTSFMDVDHDTTVHEDSSTFAKESGAGVALLEDGKYLALYNEAISIASTLDRVTFRTQLDLDGSVVDGSFGHGYIRGSSGCDECFPCGATIFDATAGDVLKVQIKEWSDTSPSPVRMADKCGLQVLKLDDDWDYCRLNAARTGVVQDPGDTITWNVSTELDSGSFALDATKKKIKLKNAGWYLVCYSLGWQNNSSPAARAICTAYIKNNSIPVWYVEQSYSSSYVRVTSGSYGATCATFLVHTTLDNEEISLVTWTDPVGGGGTFGFGDDCYISIAALPSDTLGLDIYDDTGGQLFDVSETAFAFYAETDDDSPFEHDTATGEEDVDIAKCGPFLFTGNFFAERDTGDTTRYNTLARFSRGGTASKYGCFGDYSRQYSGVPYHGGSHGILFPWLSVGDTINLLREDTSSSSGESPESVADQMGMQGIYLPSVFPGYWQGGWIKPW